jgi:hypothetical protein
VGPAALIWLLVLSGDDGRCDDFLALLKAVPHASLTLDTGEHESLWDKQVYRGCEVSFVTHDELLGEAQVPSLEAGEGSELYRKGWRPEPAYVADGPGTATFAVKRGAVVCLVSWRQPAHLEDSGEIVQSETLRIRVQCRER